jgi:IrrE N-terminal-like domain
VLEDLEGAPKIIAATERLLAIADARGRLPTPVNDIVAAARLTEPAQSLLSDDAIYEAPKHLRDKIAKLKGKVRAVLDRRTKEVHVHPDIHIIGQRNFNRLHETSHGIFDWQTELAYADDTYTLTWAPEHRAELDRQWEQEANQGAAELLFQRNLLAEMAADERIGFASIVDLSERFGASIHATFRRVVETHRGAVAGVVVSESPTISSPVTYRRFEAMHSGRWGERFGPANDWPKFLPVPSYPFLEQLQSQFQVPTGHIELTWPDVNGGPVPIHAEYFNNSYRILILLWVPQRELLKPRRVLVTTAPR